MIQGFPGLLITCFIWQFQLDHAVLLAYDHMWNFHKKLVLLAIKETTLRKSGIQEKKQQAKLAVDK